MTEYKVVLGIEENQHVIVRADDLMVGSDGHLMLLANSKAVAIFAHWLYVVSTA